MFLPEFQFMGPSRVRKETLCWNSSISHLFLKQESWKNWPNCPEFYTNSIKVNSTQNGTEMFLMLIRKTCPKLDENILNSYKALSSKNEWSLFFFKDLVIFSYFNVN